MNGFLIGETQTTPEAKCFMKSAEKMNTDLAALKAGGLSCEVFGQDFKWIFEETATGSTTPLTSFLHIVGADCTVK